MAKVFIIGLIALVYQLVRALTSEFQVGIISSLRLVDKQPQTGQSGERQQGTSGFVRG
jgi:hypothetical protein